jgi:hypothetical protein
MPTITLRSAHFDLLRSLLQGFLHEHGIEKDPTIDTAEDLLTLLTYAHNYRRVTIEIAKDEPIEERGP